MICSFDLLLRELKRCTKMGKTENVRREIASQAYRSGQAGQTLQTLLGGPIQDALMRSLDLGTISKEWETTFAQPAMEAWWKYNAPGIRDEFAGIPGAFYSADRGRGVSQAASQYMAQAVQPQLFGALQQARALMPSMIGAVTGPLTAQATGQIQPLAKDSKGSLLGGLAGFGLSFIPGLGGLGSAIGSSLGTTPGIGMGQLGSMIGGLF